MIRRDPDDRALHEHTERDLAGRRWHRVQDYADAKSPVVLDIDGASPQVSQPVIGSMAK